MSVDDGAKFPKVVEKRFHKRLDCELPVELFFDGKAVLATTANVSCGGMFMPLKKGDAKENAPITVVLTLPEQQKSVRIAGEIARVENQESQVLEGVAVRFNGLYNDNILMLERFIKAKLTH